MKKFILSNEPDNNNLIRLEGDDYHYLVRVRRLAIGEYFPALLPNGNEIEIKVTSINNDVLIGESINPSSSAAPLRHLCDLRSQKRCVMTLFQSLPKGDKMDLIVRQAAESGISEIVPFVSEFSVAKKNISGQKFTRWERIIKEARQQSGSKTATAIRQPLSFEELIEYWKSIKEKSTGLLFHHQLLEQKSLHEYLSSIDTTQQKVVIVIGPEGGFSDAETAVFLENGLLPFTIGDSILRTETAALYCAAAVKIILLEKDKWQLK